MEEKKYTRDQIKDAIWQELKESDYAGENNDRAYEVIGIVMAGVDKIVVGDVQQGAVWVKASSIKDCPLGYVFYKFNNGKTSYKGVGQFEEFEFIPCEEYANIRQKDYDYLEILDESGTAAGREEDDRNEFAEWCRMQPNYGFIRGIGWRCNITKEDYSTDFMYQLFKQQKEK